MTSPGHARGFPGPLVRIRRPDSIPTLGSRVPLIFIPVSNIINNLQSFDILVSPYSYTFLYSNHTATAYRSWAPALEETNAVIGIPNIVRGLNVREHNVRGRIVPAPHIP